jgi:uncharacterized damage-inducible protein DinB
MPIVQLMPWADESIHHAHEHRTQITTLLGQQGIEPPSLSGWNYFDEEIAPQQD